MNRTIVQCAQGALYSSIWWPLVSVKSVRMGSQRLQRCPVHRRWEKTVQVDGAGLSAAEIAEAEAVTDWPVP